MGFISWIKNIFVSDDGAQGKNGIRPVKNGEPIEASVLNRPSYIVGGRVDLLNKELEAIYNNILSRKIIIECMARNWTGYTYLDGGSVKFAAGKIGIPSNTSMTVKLIDHADETSSPTAASGIFMAIKDGSKSCAFSITTKHTSQYQSSLDKMPYSGDLVVRFKQGSSVNVTFAEEDGLYKYLEITFVAGSTTVDELINEINNSGAGITDYIRADEISGVGDEDFSTTLISQLNGVTISAAGIFPDARLFLKKFNNISAPGYCVTTFKYVKSLEFDIPYAQLKNFWDNNKLKDENNVEKGMPRGSVLAIRVPSSLADIDGTFHGQDRGKASKTPGRITLTSDDLVILYSGGHMSSYNIYNIDGLYVPIAKASNPSADTINRHSKSSEYMIDDLSYADFADGIRVGSGQVYCELAKDEVSVADNGVASSSSDSYGMQILKASLPSSVNVWSEIKRQDGTSINPFNTTYSSSNVILGLYNTSTGYHDVYKEGKVFLLRRDFMDGKVYIKFTDGDALNTLKSSTDDLWWRESKIIDNPGDGTYYPVHPMPIPFDHTRDGNESIFNNGDGYMLAGELHGAVRRLGRAVVQHINSADRYKHSAQSIESSMIKDRAVTPVKISQTPGVWEFFGQIYTVGYMESYYSDGDKGYKTPSEFSTSGMGQLLDIFKNSRSLVSKYAPNEASGGVYAHVSSNPIPFTRRYNVNIGGDLVAFPFSGSGLSVGMLCYFDESDQTIKPFSLVAGNKKYLGVYTKEKPANIIPTGYYHTIVCISGVCWGYVEEGLDVGKYLTVSSVSPGVLVASSDIDNSPIVGISLTPAIPDGTGNYYAAIYLFKTSVR